MRTAYETKFLKVFGERIATARKSLGLKQNEFAKTVGIAPSHVASIEIGRRWPHLTIIHRIAHTLNTTAYELMRGIDTEIGYAPKTATQQKT